MKSEEYIRRFDELATEEVLFNIPHRKEWVLSRIGKGKRVLDVGCLGGRFSELIAGNNNEVHGVELNAEAAREAEKRGIRVKVGDVERGLPFDPGLFDVVNAGVVLEYLYDTRNFLEECGRVLKEGGTLILTTSNLNSLENRLRVLTGNYLATTGAYPEDHFGEHIRQLNLAKIHELCEAAGFAIEEIRGIPLYEPKGTLLDAALSVAGRLAPGFSKLLMVKARKRRSS